MDFSQIYGNEKIKAALIKMIDGNQLPHAIMFSDIDGGQALAMCQSLLKYLACKNRKDGKTCNTCPSCRQIDKFIHPDIFYVFPQSADAKASEAKFADNINKWRDLACRNPFFLENDLLCELGIEKKSAIIANNASKEILRKLSISTITDSYRVILIYLPEKMNTSAANSLLKELEEPREAVLFLLISHKTEAVLPTILSRCLQIRLNLNSIEEIKNSLINSFNIEAQEAEELAKDSQFSIGQAVSLKLSKESLIYRVDIIVRLLKNIKEKNFISCLSIVEELSDLNSKEEQKEFCRYFTKLLRKIFLVNNKLENLASFNRYEQEVLALSKYFSTRFCYRVNLIIDRAMILLDRNLDPKLIFCNMICRMYTIT